MVVVVVVVVLVVVVVDQYYSYQPVIESSIVHADDAADDFAGDDWSITDAVWFFLRAQLLHL